MWKMKEVPANGQFSKDMAEAGMNAFIGVIDNVEAQAELGEDAHLLLAVVSAYAAMVRACESESGDA